MQLLLRLRALLFFATIGLITIVFYMIFYNKLRYAKNYHIKYRVAKLYSKIFIYTCRAIVGLNYHVEGLNKLPQEPSLVLANHQSFWDNVIMQLIIPEHSWVLKKQLYRIPILGSGLRMLDPIAVDRSNSISVRHILHKGTRKFQEKLWLIMFPESTRLRPEQTVKFKASAAKLALINRVPIVLVAHNAGIFWPKGFWFKRTGTIQVKIVKVLYPDEVEHFSVRELTDYIERIINKEKNNLLK